MHSCYSAAGGPLAAFAGGLGPALATSGARRGWPWRRVKGRTAFRLSLDSRPDPHLMGKPATDEVSFAADADLAPGQANGELNARTGSPCSRSCTDLTCLDGRKDCSGTTGVSAAPEVEFGVNKLVNHVPRYDVGTGPHQPARL